MELETQYRALRESLKENIRRRRQKESNSQFEIKDSISMCFYQKKVIKESEALLQNLGTEKLSSWKKKKFDQVTDADTIRKSRDYSKILSDEASPPLAPPSVNRGYCKNSDSKPRLASMASVKQPSSNLKESSLPINKQKLEQKKPDYLQKWDQKEPDEKQKLEQRKPDDNSVIRSKLTEKTQGNGGQNKNTGSKPQLTSMDSRNQPVKNLVGNKRKLELERPQNKPVVKPNQAMQPSKNLQAQQKKPDEKHIICLKKIVEKPKAASTNYSSGTKKSTTNSQCDENMKALMLIKEMFNTKRFIGRDDSDVVTEASFRDIDKEEKRSARLARQEDREQQKLIEEEERLEQMRKLKKRAKPN